MALKPIFQLPLEWVDLLPLKSSSAHGPISGGSSSTSESLRSPCMFKTRTIHYNNTNILLQELLQLQGSSYATPKLAGHSQWYVELFL